MFQSTKNRFQALLSLVDEVLAAPDEGFPEPSSQLPAAHLTHPHRRELRWERSRRPGAPRRPPAHCITPVRVERRQAGGVRSSTG